MYYPYFRGKQYELITIRENAALLERARFTPIIEPVKESLTGLERAVDAIGDAGGTAIVIVNPEYGDHAENNVSIATFLSDELHKHNNIEAGIRLTEEMSVNDAVQIWADHGNKATFVHAGFKEARGLAKQLGDDMSKSRHVFLEGHSGKLYQKHFCDAQRVLLRDGFEKRTNRLHPEVEFFSDLHITYPEEGMNGFGDFLMVGDAYSESGGPAYTIAIHLTFLDPDNDNAMYVHHFKSIRQDTPTDPAGKFAEALDKLVDDFHSTDTKIIETAALQEFLDLHKRSHFPGLGYVKKLSMMHHIETLAQYFSEHG